MASGRKFVTQVIEMYRELPCLWKRTDPYYHDKVKRNAAMDQLLELFKEQDPDITKDFVQKKIASLRGAFRKELNKVRLSECSGTSPDKIHVPKLWYYDLMLFLEDQQVPCHSSSVYSILDEMPFGDDEIGGDESGTGTEIDSLSRESTPGPYRGSFKRPRSKADQVLDKIVRKIDQPLHSPTVQMPPKQQHDAFGEHVAEKLRSLPPGQLSICQKLINDAIFYAEIGALNLSARIVPNDTLPQET
ncbi:uncharacterized protein [Halyomorpha halys]|uniref:uncharacterized protein n=1 Tax=Halyomorpha halys TaxID=286706 RepID=UPI0006D4DC60|nr:uncharacterized protein LOC106691307 [Halyomorpha halys]